MTVISMICTMCGAAALSKGILKAIEYIGRGRLSSPARKVSYKSTCDGF